MREKSVLKYTFHIKLNTTRHTMVAIVEDVRVLHSADVLEYEFQTDTPIHEGRVVRGRS